MNPGQQSSQSADGNLEEITRILCSIGENENSTDALIPLVYEELHRIASFQFSSEYPGHTMQTTALIHEAYLKLRKSNSGNWENRRHFFGAAAEAMRRILIDSARRKNTKKRSKKDAHHAIESMQAFDLPSNDELLDLNEALSELENLDPEAAELVKLRFFSGLTMRQIAEVLDVSSRQATNIWTFAQAWLYRRLSK
jgi:RNA polymerase sigma factor (TIGR02999 family)